jgi:hypothetical protein
MGDIKEVGGDCGDAKIFNGVSTEILDESVGVACAK